MNDPIDVDPVIRIVSALTLLVAIVALTHTTNSVISTGGVDANRPGFRTRSHDGSARVCATWMASRRDRLKAVHSGTDDELIKTLHGARSVSNPVSLSAVRPVHVMPGSVLIRSRKMLRC